MLNLWQRWASWLVLRKLLLTTVVVLSVGAFYVWHLGTLSPGLSAAEATARQSSLELNSVTTDPVNAPQRLLQYGLQAAGHHGAFWMRIPSVVLAIVLLSLFYLLVKTWFGRTIGILAAIMLATTPWVVLLARSATPEIMLLAPIAVLLLYDRMRRNSRQHNLAWVLLIVTLALSLYVPGLIWVVLAGLIIAHKQLLNFAKKTERKYLLISAIIGLALVSPLIIAVVREPNIGKTLVLWPTHWLGVVGTIKATAWAALSLVWRTPYHLDIIVGRLPILDVTQIVLAIFGVYAMLAKARSELYAIFGLIALGILAAGIDHNLLLLSLGLPAIAVLGAAGLRYLYLEWRSVFPHNPIPRALAIIVMVGLVALHSLFGIRYSLIAWPHTVDTRKTYVIK